MGLTDEVIRTELVWVRLYRDAMERLQRMAARESQVKFSTKAAKEMSNETNLGWLGYIGDEILPSCIGLR